MRNSYNVDDDTIILFHPASAYIILCTKITAKSSFYEIRNYFRFIVIGIIPIIVLKTTRR